MAAVAEHHHTGTSNTLETGANGGEFNGHHEKYGGGGAVNRYVTPGGHPADSSQPAFPVYHRKLANPAPLGLLG